ncbi:hypothetical protein [Chitinophaga sp. W3I9]|uniref:hypothetical protein n=1 Tax=Chitinophaga sp. W3I9 TaxID=3373924 RepID=UPI003D2449F0
MKTTTEINEANAILRTYSGAHAKIFMFSPSLGRMALRLALSKTEEVIYLVGIACKQISGEFSFDNADFQISTGPEVGMTTIFDSHGKFKLLTSGGFLVAQGLEQEFGRSFDDFIADNDRIE